MHAQRCRIDGQTFRSHTEDTHGTCNKAKTLKVEILSTAEEEQQEKGRVLRQKEKRAAKEEKGVSRLTGSPSVLGLPPPSVYRCPAETEGTTELHTPPSSTHLTATLETSRLYGRILVLCLF